MCGTDWEDTKNGYSPAALHYIFWLYGIRLLLILATLLDKTSNRLILSFVVVIVVVVVVVVVIFLMFTSC